MSNSFFQFKQFIIHQDRCAMKVTTDACLFGAWVAKEIVNQKLKIETILDIGTGTGLLSLMLAQQANVTIDAIEIDKEAYNQAKENINTSKWAGRIKIVYGDVNEYNFSDQYDLIISNPPFYEKELTSADIKRNIAIHNEGLLLDELLQIIKRILRPGGRFYILLPYKRNNEIETLFKQKELAIIQKVFVRQSSNHDYFRIMITGIHQKENERALSTSDISIWNDKQQYTEEFIELLKDYYLYL